MFCVYTFTQASCQYLFHWSNASVRIFSNSALVSIPFIYRQHVHARVCACEYRLCCGMKLIIEPSFSLLSPPASAFPAEAISKICKSAEKKGSNKGTFFGKQTHFGYIFLVFGGRDAIPHCPRTVSEVLLANNVKLPKRVVR